MKKVKKASVSVALAALLTMSAVPLPVSADNPIVQTAYTADGAPMVWNDTFYMYTGHDEGNSGFFSMNEWRCYSSTDMKNWTDLGSPLAYADFAWASGDAWAGQCVERDGKFYYYVTVTAKSGGRAIGVAVADRPEGPFKDAIGKPLVGPMDGLKCIDPTVFVDDDGQAYMYWGNGDMWYVKLGADMISLAGEQVSVDTRSGAFGGFYDEAPHLYKRNGLYYMVYAADALPQNVSYSTATSLEGPWKYGGVIMMHGGNAATNHPGIIDYKGKTYLTYHTGTLAGGGDHARSECIEEITWNADGTIPHIERTDAGCEQIEWLNPYVRTEAETICWGSGLVTEKCSAGGMNVCDIQNGEYLKVGGVDFGKGAERFRVSASSATNGGTLTLRLDSPDGKVIGKCNISATGGWQTWKEYSCNITDAEGVHDLYFTFEGSGWALFNMDWWQFEIDRSTIIKGDLNSDGVINAFDLAIAKRGILKGLTDPLAANAADVDENGALEVTDLILLNKWLFHQITEFPLTEHPTESPAITITPEEYMKQVEAKIVNSEPSDAVAEKAGTVYGTYEKETIYSQVCNRNKSFNVLIPANYSVDKKYPVLYVLHGYWGNEDALLDAGDASLRLRQIIGNAIAAGEAEDMIVVFPDIYASATQDKCDGLDAKNNAAYDNFINLLIKEIMPYMEQNYSIKTGRENTAITGFSMGGRESLNIGFSRPDLFGYVGAMCPAPGLMEDQIKPENLKFTDIEPYLLLVSAGSNDTLIWNTPQGYHDQMNKNGVTHIWHYVNGGDHGGKSIRPHMYNFVRSVFKAE